MARLTTEAIQDGIGRRVAELRSKRGLTQERLAALLGVSSKRVQRLEYGANITIATLVELANTLDAPLREFFRAPKGARAQAGRPRSRRPPRSKSSTGKRS